MVSDSVSLVFDIYYYFTYRRNWSSPSAHGHMGALAHGLSLLHPRPPDNQRFRITTPKTNQLTDWFGWRNATWHQRWPSFCHPLIYSVNWRFVAFSSVLFPPLLLAFVDGQHCQWTNKVKRYIGSLTIPNGWEPSNRLNHFDQLNACRLVRLVPISARSYLVLWMERN